MELCGTKEARKEALVNQSNGYISGKHIQGTNTFYKDAYTFNEIYEIHLYEELESQETRNRIEDEGENKTAVFRDRCSLVGNAGL